MAAVDEPPAELEVTVRSVQPFHGIDEGFPRIHRTFEFTAIIYLTGAVFPLRIEIRRWQPRHPQTCECTRLKPALVAEFGCETRL